MKTKQPRSKASAAASPRPPTDPCRLMRRWSNNALVKDVRAMKTALSKAHEEATKATMLWMKLEKNGKLSHANPKILSLVNGKLPGLVRAKTKVLAKEVRIQELDANSINHEKEQAALQELQNCIDEFNEGPYADMKRCLKDA